MLGEAPERLRLDRRGVIGDRLWSVRTAAGKIGSGKNTRRFAVVEGLQELRANEVDGDVAITFPDGRRCAVDHPDVADYLSQQVGQPVTLARETDASHFDDGPVSLIAAASVGAVADERGVPVSPDRFRPNVVLEGLGAFAEEAWVGRRLRIGTAILTVEMTSPRCVMIDHATADLPPQPGNLLAVGRINSARLGVVASVHTPGEVAAGDSVSLV